MAFTYHFFLDKSEFQHIVMYIETALKVHGNRIYVLVGSLLTRARARQEPQRDGSSSPIYCLCINPGSQTINSYFKLPTETKKYAETTKQLFKSRIPEHLVDSYSRLAIIRNQSMGVKRDNEVGFTSLDRQAVLSDEKFLGRTRLKKPQFDYFSTACIDGLDIS
jgi:hypothetical protein